MQIAKEIHCLVRFQIYKAIYFLKGDNSDLFISYLSAIY